MSELKNLLNKEQYQSVTHIDGPSVILAGAGSGKTRVITYKIINLIQNGIPAEKILALTFTNKAAREMKERVAEKLGKKKNLVLLTTFHSLGLKILKENITNLDYKSKFSIYDEKDCMKILKDILHELKLPEEKYDAYELLFKISLIKMHLKTKIEDQNLNDIYKKYNEYLKLYNALDFDDLIKLPIELFEKFPEILKKYRNKWKYILVDEYQDTSYMQYRILKLLAHEHKNISIVGDDDQSIYSWRGANSDNFSLFENDFSPVFEIRLEQNYRSTSTILNAANAIIKINTNRKEKNLWTNGAKGEKIGFYEALDEEEEALFVTTMINTLTSKYELRDLGILFRMNSLSRPFEEKLRENNIPYKMVGGMKFFDRPEIRDIVSYMRFLANTEDEVALFRILNNPKRGIGNTTIQAILEFSKEHKCGVYSTIKNFVSSNILGNKVTPYIEDFYKLIEKYREMIFKPKNIARTMMQLVDEIDYRAKLISELKDLKKIGYRMNNINQLYQSIMRYENDPDNFDPNIFDYLQRISLANQDDDEDRKDNQVNMMSIHSAKGLEFKVVFIVGAEDGLLPHFKTLEETGSDQEERRLFYVAITRARELLYISYPKIRMKFNESLNKEPSYFIKEIPEELMEAVNIDDKLPDNSLGELLKKWNG
jgi:DNA helicase II / ATP-dependent DNA helicase PcrA